MDHVSPHVAGIVITDSRKPGQDGFDRLQDARGVDSNLPATWLTGEGDIAMAVRGARWRLRRPRNALRPSPCRRRRRQGVPSRAPVRQPPPDFAAILIAQGKVMVRALAHLNLLFPGQSPPPREWS